MAPQITLAILNALFVGGAIYAISNKHCKEHHNQYFNGITRIVILNVILYWGGWFAPFTR